MQVLRSLVRLRDEVLNHKEVARIAQGLHPIDSDFPWDSLRRYADRCIKSQKGITIPEGLDMLLFSFIQGHPQSSKDIAVATCAHAISTEATFALLNGPLRCKSTDFEAVPIYIQTLLAIHHSNPSVVSDAEASLAKALLPLLSLRSFDPGRLLQSLSVLFVKGIPNTSLLAPHITTLAEYVSLAFSTQLETFKATSSWMATSRLVSWIQELPKQLYSVRSGYHSLEPILDASFPDWRAYAQWSPNKHDLSMFERKLGNADHLAFRDILALEGPCFGNTTYSTLKEQYIAEIPRTKSNSLRHQSLDIVLARYDGLYVTTILNMLNAALRVASHAKTSADDSKLLLFKQICTGRVVEESGLQLLEHCFAIDDTALTRCAAAFLQQRAKNTEPPVSAFMELVDTLNVSPEEEPNTDPRQKLRELLEPDILSTALKIFHSQRDAIRSILNINREWKEQDLSIFEDFQGFGQALVNSKWLTDSLGSELGDILLQWPLESDISECYAIRAFSLSQNGEFSSFIATNMADYLSERLVQLGTMASSNLRSVESLKVLWQTCSDLDRRTLGLILIERGLKDSCDSRYMMEQLPSLDGVLVKALLKTLRAEFENPEDGCIALAQSLVSTHHGEAIHCFRPILLQIIESQGESLMNYTLQNLGIDAFLRWMEYLEVIFDDEIACGITSTSPILSQTFLKWTRRLSKDVNTLKALESTKSLRFGPAMRCLIRGGSPELEYDLVRILDFLRSTYDESRLRVLRLVTAQLHQDGHNSSLITNSMPYITTATPTGAQACIEVLETYEEAPLGVSEVILGAWHSSPELMPNDTVALEMIAEILGFDTTELEIPSFESLQAAEKHFEEQYNALLAEARRLEAIRLAFKSLDATGTALMLQANGIEDNHPLDEILESLPPDLIDVVERTGENEVELQIPLSNISALQRKAMGFKINAQSLLVRLVLGEKESPLGFCIHFDNETEANSATEHYPHMVMPGSDDPTHPYCHGRPTPVVYQLSRTLSRYFRTHGFTTLQQVYTLICTEIADLGSKCVACGKECAVKLRRAMPCTECRDKFQKSCLDVRVSDVRQDPAVVDLLLTAIYATACSGNLTLIADCPIKTTVMIKQILDALPSISNLQERDSLEAIISSLGSVHGSGSGTSQLLSWICNNYGGFLTSAADSLKIPSLPGSHQFLLASAAPHLEMAFAKKAGTTKIVWHGTSMERLYAILCDGLKDLSGTALQRHGHSYGKGVYVAENPATAWGFAATTTQSWAGSKLGNTKVLLGVELAGDWPPVSNNGICVVTDPTCLMVRYIFLMTPNATIPLVQHVTPAMSSIFASLRSGAI